MEQHEVNAYYAMTPLGQKKFLSCSCGFSAWGECWADAGMEMDEHLAKVSDGAREE